MTLHSEGVEGRWIVLVGPDGSGKTTVARAVIEQHAGPSAYIHFLPPILGRLACSPETDPPPPPPKATAGGSRVLGWARLLRNAVRCWAGYLGAIRPALRRGRLVVGDRWMYGYLAQPRALRFFGPRVVARWILKVIPHPHLVVNLSAPAPHIHARKGELTIPEIERELLAWSSLGVPHLETIDATRSPEAIALDILRRLHVRPPAPVASEEEAENVTRPGLPMPRVAPGIVRRS